MLISKIRHVRHVCEQSNGFFKGLRISNLMTYKDEKEKVDAKQNIMQNKIQR